jgi:acyl-CoA thioesterase
LTQSVTGYFTIIGLADEPFTYKVQTVREGNNYIVKRVDCVQEDGVQICFTNLCSFKKTEDKFLNIQVPKKMEEKWAKLLGGRKVEDLPLGSNFKDLR